MVAAAKQKKASNNSTESPRKDFSKLYKKKIAPITIPIKVPSMGLDVELEYTPPTEEVEALLDRYIIAVASSNPENPGNAAAPSDEYWLKVGKRQLLDLAVYIKKIGAKQKAEELVEETGGVKTPELVGLRSRMVKAIAELDAALEPKFEEYEKLSFYMVSDSNALDILHNCIALCFQEFEEPEQLEDQVKFFLIMSLLSITGRVLAM